MEEDDLDPAAFLKSVRELSERREREDLERFRKLEQEVEKGRQERLARRAEYARSISPEKRVAMSSPVASRIEDVPEFKGFGSARKSSGQNTSAIASPKGPSSSTTARLPDPAIPTMKSPSIASATTPALASAGSMSPTISSPSTSILTPRASPSAAMPSRSGSMKWQQRPQSRGGASRPLSMVAAENAASQTTRADSPGRVSPERSREDIASALGSKDPSWFRQTADRGIGSAAYRKSDESGLVSNRQGLPGMMDARSSSTVSSTMSSAPYSANPATGSGSNTQVTLDYSTASGAATSGVAARLNRGSSRSPSPTKEGGFVRSAMLKRSDSITKRTSAPVRSEALKPGVLQGSHSMPRLEPASINDSTDSLVRPLSSMDLNKSGMGHARHRSITSAYTTNGTDSPPASPSRRWSPTKSSWIESALTAKQEARPPSPPKNAQPAWMASLAKAKVERQTTSSESSQDTFENKPRATVGTSALLSSPISTSQPLQEKNYTPQQTVSGPAGGGLSVRTSTYDALGIDTLTAVQRVDSAPQQLTDPVAVAEPTTGTSLAVRGSVDSTKQKPALSPKPQIDFRSTLRSRAPAAAQVQEQPEFLARFGSLKKATTEKYVAPDLLKNNILRGKAALNVTDGPQKTEIRDEFKDSLQAKKEEWKRDKEQGIIHDHKTAAPPVVSKPEALTKREVLGRSGTTKASPSPEKDKVVTPEALRRHQSIRSKPEAPMFAVKGAGKLASRMDPQLVNMLARGPPPSTDNSQIDKAETSVVEDTRAPTSAEPLQDMRKGRAKGPKRRNAGMAADDTRLEQSGPGQTIPLKAADEAVSKPLGHTKPISTASVMLAALDARQASPHTPPAISTRSWPIPTPEKITYGTSSAPASDSTQQRDGSPTKDVPAFAGFGKAKASSPAKDDVKENRASDLSFLPSVKQSAATWAEQPTPRSSERPPPIQLPSKKDEEAAMRSAGLLAAASPVERPSVNGPPLIPSKSSRSVSGQLQESSPNKGIPVKPPDPRARQAVIDVFGHLPRFDVQLRTQLPSQYKQQLGARTLRREVYELNTVSTRLERLSSVEEYTFHDEGHILLIHVSVHGNGAQDTTLYLWHGAQADSLAGEHITDQGLTMARQNRATMKTIEAGRETAAFLQAIGGILVSRRGQRPHVSVDFLLCGRKHFGYIVFDEVDIEPCSLCSAFAYLLHQARTGRLFLWRGSACTLEELSAARMVAMELSTNGHFDEINDGEESAEFLAALGCDEVRIGFAYCSPQMQQRVSLNSDFEIRLYRLQLDDMKQGRFSSLFSRRPSWISGSTPEEPPPKVTMMEVSPFLQSDLEADSLFILDACSQLLLLVGPLFASTSPDGPTLFAQGLLCCEQLVVSRTHADASVILRGVPRAMRYLVRRWDQILGMWSTASLMAGSHRDAALISLPLRDVLDVIRSTG